MTDRPEAVKRKQELADEWMRGYLVCLSSLTRGATGCGTEARELFSNVGSPTHKECKRLGLANYDLENLKQLRELL